MARVPAPPIIFNETVPLGNERRTFISSRMFTPIFVPQVSVAFADNTNRTLRVSFWYTYSRIIADNVEPTGINLGQAYGGSAFLVGDGLEGRLNLNINAELPQGGYFAVSALNTDGFDHTLDSRIDIERIIVPELV